ncbi:hypothetical protein E1B28_007667 [Marasmius oreades]|uniref:FYVE-type domain-containing protein n=1 Tax=Marasmius oreades TaxID=181124 RepID=A0A9P7S234_9AGAR|nr:uncharacterized protein E1B28_007667 [Marasmius oreades]KAG7094046.1 hypothetical protein E1B28_007667 [Marasmius oreades]
MSGLPLLSGPPPNISNSPEDVACRKCNKEFNFLFTRPRRCNHCGYTYCHNCTDYQALMPRSSGPGDSGYDPMNVCAFCIEYLPITAAGRGQLRSLPLSKLKKYAGAYNIPIDGAVEKDDVINTLFAIRGGNGCLPPANEAFYRAHSVPNRSSARPRGLFSSRPEPQPNLPPRPQIPPSRTEFSRPDLEPQPPHRPPPNYETRPPNSPPRNANHHAQLPPWGNHPQYTPPPPPPHPQYATYTRPQTTPPRPPSSSRPPPSTTTRPPPPPSISRPTASSPAPPPPPPPSLDELLNMSERNISSLPISSLKQILFLNHVNATNMMILEKSDLVKRVVELVEVERGEREEREAREREEREEEERLIREVRKREESEKRAREEAERRSRDGQQTNATTDRRARVEDAPEEDESVHSSIPQEEIDILPPASDRESPPTLSPTISTTEPSVAKPPTRLTAKAHERNSGLCVICQDEDANIAIVDCG